VEPALVPRAALVPLVALVPEVAVPEWVWFRLEAGEARLPEAEGELI